PLRQTLVDVLSVLGQERKELGSLLELLPSLPTYAGIDAVLASLEDPSKADAALKKLKPQGSDENTKKRFLYLEASLLLAGKKDGDQRAEDYRESVRWLLECLQAGELIRLNCGGEEYRDKKGQTWGKDRFFLGGKAEKGWFQGGVHGTEDPALYIAGRAFSWD